MWGPAGSEISWPAGTCFGPTEPFQPPRSSDSIVPLATHTPHPSPGQPLPARAPFKITMTVSTGTALRGRGRRGVRRGVSPARRWRLYNLPSGGQARPTRPRMFRRNCSCTYPGDRRRFGARPASGRGEPGKQAPVPDSLDADGWPEPASRGGGRAQYDEPDGSRAGYGQLPEGCRTAFLLHDVKGFERRDPGHRLGNVEVTGAQDPNTARVQLQNIVVEAAGVLTLSPSSRTARDATVRRAVPLRHAPPPASGRGRSRARRARRPARCPGSPAA